MCGVAVLAAASLGDWTTTARESEEPFRTGPVIVGAKSAPVLDGEFGWDFEFLSLIVRGRERTDEEWGAKECQMGGGRDKKGGTAGDDGGKRKEGDKVRQRKRAGQLVGGCV